MGGLLLGIRVSQMIAFLSCAFGSTLLEQARQGAQWERRAGVLSGAGWEAEWPRG